MNNFISILILFITLSSVSAADKWEYLTLDFFDIESKSQTIFFQIDGIESVFYKFPSFVNDPTTQIRLINKALETSIKGKKSLAVEYHMPKLFDQSLIKSQIILNMLGKKGWEMVGTSRVIRDHGQFVDYYVFKRKLMK